jgi:hypothetical protein
MVMFYEEKHDDGVRPKKVLNVAKFVVPKGQTYDTNLLVGW